MFGSVKIALVGICGYGSSYLRYFFDEPTDDSIQLVGVIDVSPEKCTYLQAIKDRQIPIYSDLDSFFAEHTADLVIISSPIQWHCRQSCQALERGANVLCEKPVAATIQEARQMQETADRAGKFVAIGYQWSFSDSVHRLKADILNGTLGTPELLKTLVCWPRQESYFKRSNWAGALRAADGSWVLDSPVNNATAHYLHNMLYVLGESECTSALPRDVIGEAYRANPIQNYDAAALRCTTQSGVPILFYTAHCVSEQIGPVAEYRFSNATVRIDAATADAEFTAVFTDGSRKSYGTPNLDQQGKFAQAVKAARGEGPIRCNALAAASHTLVVNGLQESIVEPVAVPPEMIHRVGGSGEQLLYVQGLHEAWQSCFDDEQLPAERKAFPWTRPGKRIDLRDYDRFPAS